MLERALEARDRELAQHLERAIEHDRKVQALEAEYARPASGPRSELLRLDNQLDRGVSAINAALSAYVAGLPAEDPLARRAAGLLEEVFPAGVGAITSLAYAEEIVAVEALLGRLGDGRPAELKALHLGPLVDALARTATAFRTALGREQPQAVSYDQVRAAQARGQDLLLQTIAMVLGRFPGSTPQDLQQRATLLAPILRQNDEIGASHRSRRAGRDVDPGTGDPIPPTGPSPAPQPSQPPAQPA